MSAYRRPRRMPVRRSHLERLVSAYGNAEGLAPDRVRRWLNAMVLIATLDHIREPDAEPCFLVKGGVAMELRLRGGARATKDLDIIFRGGTQARLLEALDTAFSEPYCGFSFLRGEVKPIGDTGAQRLDVRLTFNGKPWATVQVEIAPLKGSATEAEEVPAISIEDFGFNGPQWVTCLSIRYQIAQKLHACTEQFAGGRENDRFRDLIDLLLMRDLTDDLPRVREACLDIFEVRAKHTWPPELVVPESWMRPYALLAGRLNFAVADVTAAAVEVRRFIAAIESAKSDIAERSGT